MTLHQDRLRRLGQYVLETLSKEQDWSASTLDDIADYASCIGLADTSADGFFVPAGVPAEKDKPKPFPVGPHDRSWCG